MRPKYIYTDIFFFLFVFPKLPVMDTFNKQFCKPTDMPMYFSVFLGQKHAAYCEFYLSLCTYGNMIQYAVQLFCFSRDFYHPKMTPQPPPSPFQRRLPHISHFYPTIMLQMLVPGTFLGALSSLMRKKKKEKSLNRSDARGTRHKTFMSVVARRCPLMFIKPRGEGLWGFMATANTLQTHHSVIFFFFCSI